MKVLLIVNQKAGKGNPAIDLVKILNVLSGHNIDPIVHLTQFSGDAKEVAQKNAPLFDRIICYGGDGTLDEVVSGIISSDVDITIGYIPAGSTNDFASSLRLPFDVASASETTVTGKIKKVDIGSFNQRPFIYVAAFGVFTEVSYKTNQDMKNVLGHTAYILEGVKNLFEIKPYNMSITIENEVIDGEFIFGMVSNSESIGGMKNITGNDVYMDDGLFEVTLVKMPKTLHEMDLILRNIIARKSVDGLIYYRKAKKISCVSTQLVSWTIDGEDGGNNTEVIIECNEHKLHIMVNEE